MGSEDGSTHLKPYILLPLGVRFVGESGKNLNSTESNLRQRIGTPAPQKKNPIPDDLDLDNFEGGKGNPSIRVESCKPDELQRGRNHNEKLKPLSADTPGSGNHNLSCRLMRKPNLQPLARGDCNGNDIKKSQIQGLSDLKGEQAEKIYMPSKRASLKTVTRKTSLANI